MTVAVLNSLMSRQSRNCARGSGMTEDSHDYYIRYKNEIMDQFEKMVLVAAEVGQNHLSEETLSNLIRRSREELEALLPSLPYLGGKKSLSWALMLQSAQTLAFYKACKSVGMEVREFAQLMYEVGEAYYDSLSGMKKRVFRWMASSGLVKRGWKRWAAETQRRQYPGDWVGEFVEGDGKSFDWGLNLVECGWLKLIGEHHAEEAAPYACLGDFVRMRALGVGFMRTQTRACGHPMCDFRFVRGYQTPRGWPPENLEEFKTRSQAKQD